MSDKKQSSVEWLVEKIQQANPSFKFDALKRQAKAMHREEIENAFDVGSDSYYDLSNPSNSEDYYNETYGDE
jgi:hypothetical protein